MTLSANFTVEGSSAVQAHSVSYGQTIDLALLSLSDVSSIAWSIPGTSKTDFSAPTITPAGSPSGATASFVMPSDPGDGLGRSVLVKCLVADANGVSVAAYRVVGVANSGGVIPVAAGEENHRHATHGYIDEFNRAIGYSATSLLNTQTFTANGTWTKQAGAKLVLVDVTAAGGGGGGGRGGAAASARSGGTGGGGGARVRRLLVAGELASSEPVTVGSGGKAGAGGSSGHGTAGAGGGFSSFGPAGYGVFAYGGGAGTGTTANARSGGGGGGVIDAGTAGADNTSSRGGHPAVTAGGSPGFGSGGSGSSTTSAFPAEWGGACGGPNPSDGSLGFEGGVSYFAGGGGGAGGGVTAANAASAGSDGGYSGSRDDSALDGNGGKGGAATGAVGSDGTTALSGTGGGGGGGNAASTGGKGGAGGVPGGGGGGGGGGTTTGGDGGAGGRGQVTVYTFG